jgi:hypothetical protein
VQPHHDATLRVAAPLDSVGTTSVRGRPGTHGQREAAVVFRRPDVERDRPDVVRRRFVEPELEDELEDELEREPLLPFLLELALFDVSRTRATRSSGSSDARVFASSTTFFAPRENVSLRMKAYRAAPVTGSSRRRITFPRGCRLPCAASAIADIRSA